MNVLTKWQRSKAPSSEHVKIIYSGVARLYTRAQAAAQIKVARALGLSTGKDGVNFWIGGRKS